MELKFKEDENGRIADDDAIFDTLNERLDNEEYDDVITRITSISREKWSNKLRFLLICAYNNIKDYDKAEKELDEIAPLCEALNDRARYCYQRGYLCSETGQKIAAQQFFSDALEFDPEYAASIDLESDIEDCDKEISDELDAFHELCGKVSADIKKRCGENAVKRKLTDEEFQTRLGFFPAIRKLPGFERPMGFGDYFTTLAGGDRKKTLKWFDEFYGITDTESFFKHIHTDSVCNSAIITADALAFLAGKPNFDVNELNKSGKFAFGNTVMFVAQFAEYLPRGGVFAWDIGEKIGFARHAYRCGIIDNADYRRGMLSMTDMAKNAFSSWEEYMRSLIYGAAMFIFRIEGWSVKSVMTFISQMMPLLLDSDLADVGWGGEQETVQQ